MSTVEMASCDARKGCCENRVLIAAKDGAIFILGKRVLNPGGSPCLLSTRWSEKAVSKRKVR